MALPEQDMQWPPAELAEITPKLAEWSAWYSNDQHTLEQVYTSKAGRPGLFNRIAAWFWSSKSSDSDPGTFKLHVPIASDLCQVSADLLLSEPPTVTVAGDKVAQERLALIAGPEFVQVLVDAVEVSAALGGTYLRATWDDKIADSVFVTKVDADGAWPEFRYGRLQAVTFWRIVATDSTTVYRHLERHELDENGTGWIYHGLYQGSHDLLGRNVPLLDQRATAPLADMVDAFGRVSTESPGLAVVYIPNMSPNRRWRNNPHGAPLGRSDLDGIEPLLDAFDRVYSSLMRDIEIGKGRVLVAQSALHDLGAGKGASFDIDQSVFVGLNLPPGPMGGTSSPVQQLQFDIRVDEHLRAAADLYTQIVRTAGYSSQTFGEKDTSANERTATEITAKERRSYLTRDRKLRSLKPQTEKLLTKALLMDAAKFNNTAKGAVTVTFADAIQESPLTMANTLQMLKSAEAMSIQLRVQTLHPDWDENAVLEEVARIKTEQGSLIPDPTGFAFPSEVTGGEPTTSIDTTGADPTLNG
ncbi:MAG: phage portal protein [Renibacterium salmoninarum]|nr:phage portal protein [Renibacterium salmoninarum]